MLRGAGGIAIALPFLDIMASPKPAKAAGGKPKRLVVVYSPNGFNTLPSTMDFAGTGLAPLSRHKSRINLIRGLDMKSAKIDPQPLDRSHYLGWGHLLTGDNVLDKNVGGNVSFDMLIAERMGGATPLPYSMHGIPHDEGQSPVSWLARGVAAKAEIRPDRAFSKLFSGLNVDPEVQDARIAQQKSILDYVKGSIERTECVLGSEDKSRLDQHLTAIRDVEMRIGLTGGGMSCAVPAAPGTGLPFPDVSSAHRELLAMAMACDLARVGSLQYSHVAGGGTPTWAGVNDLHHEISHRQDADGLAMMNTINAWYAEEIARFVDRLIELKDAEGAPLMDSTCIVWVQECGFPGHGHIGDLIRSVNMTAVVIGSAGGALKTNQYLNIEGTPHQNLWVELINALSPDDLEPVSTFGNPTTCTGGLSAIRA
jgi:hypothetical protein